MHETTFVRIGQRIRHAFEDRQRLRVRHALELRSPQDPAQRLAGQIFHGQIDHRAIAIEVVHRHDVAMPERLRLLRFALQRNERFRIAAKLQIQNLDRNVRTAIGCFELAQVERFVDRSHAAHTRDTPRARSAR